MTNRPAIRPRAENETAAEYFEYLAAAAQALADPPPEILPHWKRLAEEVLTAAIRAEHELHARQIGYYIAQAANRAGQPAPQTPEPAEQTPPLAAAHGGQPPPLAAEYSRNRPPNDYQQAPQPPPEPEPPAPGLPPLRWRAELLEPGNPGWNDRAEAQKRAMARK